MTDDAGRTRTGNILGIVFGGYAEDIITNPAEYDWVEIQPVRDISDPEKRDILCEACDVDEAEFWSTYAHLRVGGVECIGDFATREEAEAYGETIAKQRGWPLRPPPCKP